jgi:hypothetical protein
MLEERDAPTGRRPYVLVVVDERMSGQPLAGP